MDDIRLEPAVNSNPVKEGFIKTKRSVLYARFMNPRMSIDFRLLAYLEYEQHTKYGIKITNERIASVLNISIRHAQRALHNLITNKYVQVIGEREERTIFASFEGIPESRRVTTESVTTESVTTESVVSEGGVTTESVVRSRHTLSGGHDIPCQEESDKKESINDNNQIDESTKETSRINIPYNIPKNSSHPPVGGIGCGNTIEQSNKENPSASSPSPHPPEGGPAQGEAGRGDAGEGGEKATEWELLTPEQREESLAKIKELIKLTRRK